MLGFRGPAQPSPTLGDALNAGYGFLEVRCLGCETHQTVALDIIRWPKTTPIHELERYMRCRDCSQLRGHPYKRSHLVALRATKISASDPPSTWWPGERQGGNLPQNRSAGERDLIVVARRQFHKLTLCDGVPMIIAPTQLHQPQDSHLQAVKTQIARCIETENRLKAEERRERAQQLGLDLDGEGKKHRQPAA
jgi:hypothetical protein